MPMLPLCLLLAFPASATPQADARPTAAEAFAAPYDLLQVVPLETSFLWSWRGDGRTAALEREVLQVVDAVLAERFDSFALDTLDRLGAPPELVRELRSARNLVTSLAGLVPWRELVRHETVYAEGAHAGRLLACRPPASQAADLERTLSATLGSVAGMFLVPLRYDIARDELRGTTTYRLALRGEDEGSALVQVAVHDGVFLIGLGGPYFAEALDLLRGGGGERLATSVRFLDAFGELPIDGAARSYVDLALVGDDLDRLQDLLAEREFHGGLWQGFFNDALGLADTMETIATTADCRGDQLVLETLTRFDPESSGAVRAGLAAPASPALLHLVPRDAISFSMRGGVDPGPIFRWAQERWVADWAPAADVLWIWNVLEAALGISLEEDVLSWLGSEQVSMVLPSRRPGATKGSTDTVWLARLRDPEGARKCLERLEAVYGAAAPRLIEGLQRTLRENQVPFYFDVRIQPGREPLPGVRDLRISAFPLPIPPMVYGTTDDLLVFATSRQALQACLSVAAEEADGLAAREHMGHLLDDAALCSARMAPAGAGYVETAQTLTGVAGWLGNVERSLAEQNPEGAQALGALIELLGKVGNVLASVDFLGDSLTTSEIREDGLARYERTALHLVLPEPVPARLEPSVAGAAH